MLRVLESISFALISRYALVIPFKSTVGDYRVTRWSPLASEMSSWRIHRSLTTFSPLYSRSFPILNASLLEHNGVSERYHSELLVSSSWKEFYRHKDHGPYLTQFYYDVSERLFSLLSEFFLITEDKGRFKNPIFWSRFIFSLRIEMRKSCKGDNFLLKPPYKESRNLI